jgi:hypothetical protein
MDIALTAQFYQNYFSNDVNDGAATNVEVIRSFLGLATGAMLAAGELLAQLKEELGREFGSWLYSNEFVTSDVNRLIKLFDYFGDNFDALSEVSPLQLLRLVVPSQSASRDQLDDFIDECNEAGFPVTCADIDSIQKQHKIKPIPTIKSLTAQTPDAANESNVDVGMVGNTLGGVGIFRLEVKDYQLANELDTQWKESGFTGNQWMRFMSTSARVVQDIAQIVLGRTIADESELDELLVALKMYKVEAKNDDVCAPREQIDVGGNVEWLPTAVSDCLKSLNELDSFLASCSKPFATEAVMHQEDRDRVIDQLKMLAVEHELDLEALLLTVTDSTKVQFVTR